MADNFYPIPENPAYLVQEIRQLQDTDPASATQTLNPLVEKLLESIEHLNLYKTPATRKVNGKSLSADITLNAGDVGALPANGTAASATKLAEARTIDGLNFDGSSNISRYVRCETAADDPDKKVTVNNFVLTVGATLLVNFHYTNTTQIPTLSVNDGAAARIVYGYDNKYFGFDNFPEYLQGDVLLTYHNTMWYVDGCVSILGEHTANKSNPHNVTAAQLGMIPIEPNAGAHNGIYRGKFLGNSATPAQYSAIAAGTFDDLFIGDYWTIGGVNWRIAAFDYCLNCGDTNCTTTMPSLSPIRTCITM